MPKAKGKKGQEEDVDMEVDAGEESDEAPSKSKGGKGNKKAEAPKKQAGKKGKAEESEEEDNKKGGKQAKKKGGNDSDDEDNKPKGKGKKGNKKAESDEEEEEKGKSNKKGNDKGKKGKKDESEEEEEHPKGKKGGKQAAQKKGKKDESEDEEPQNTKQAKKGGKKAASDDEEEAPAQKGKQGKKGNKKVEEEEEEDVPKGKQGKKGKAEEKSKATSKKGKKQESEDEEEEEEEEAPKKGGKQQQKGKQAPAKKGGKKAESEDEEEEESEEEAPKKGGKQQSKQAAKAKKGGKKAESEDEEESEEEAPKKGGKQQSKQAAKQAPAKKGGKKAESEDEEEEESEEEKPKKGGKAQPAKKGGKKVESEDEEEEEEEEEEESEDEKPKKGGKPQPKKAAPAKKPAKEESEEEEAEPVAGMVSKKNKKNKKKGGRKEESEDSEPEVKKGGGGFAGLDVEDDEEESKPAAKKKPNKKANKGGFAGLDVEGEDDEEVTKGVAALSIKAEPKAKEPKVSKLKSSDDTRSKKQIRMERKNAAKADSQPAEEEKREKTAEELEAEANERYNRAQDMKGKEPPPFVHLRNSEEVRNRLGNDIRVENYTLTVPGRTLLADANFTMAYGHKYGFVGRNGLGKSTLLKKIAERDGIKISSHLRVLYVDQEVPGDETLPIDYVLKADVEREWLLNEERILTKLESEDPDWMDNPDEKRCYGLKEIGERLRDIESEKAVSRASAILVGLGFDAQEIKSKTSKEFSGGWRMRISLARALFCRPEVLLLDEPTNHLDLHACFWLERYLSKWKNTLLVVSHEATFLNEIVDHILEIRSNKTLTTYKGDYWAYQKTREQIDTTKLKQKDKVDKEKKRLKEVIQRTAGKSGGGGKETILNSLQDITIDRDDPSLKVSFPEPEMLTPPIYQFQDVSFGYDPSKLLFKNLEFGIDMESRIALVGLNGVGKSTIMKLMAGELKETSGYIFRNRKIRIARFSQHSLEQLNPELTPMEYLDSLFRVGSQHELRQHLGRFGITGNLALNKIDTLSGGQKSRVVLAELSYSNPHLLFLDEPSNHLDLDAIEALAYGLNQFKGGVVLISHNQRLIAEVCNEIWVVTKAGTVERFNGEFDDYKQDILASMDFAGMDDEEEDEEKERAKLKEMKKAKKAEKAEKEENSRQSQKGGKKGKGK